MDMKDVSHEIPWDDYVGRLIENGQQGKQKPLNHLSCTEVLELFTKQINSSPTGMYQDRHGTGRDLPAVQYPPSLAPSDRLEPIMISQMSLEEAHPGTMVHLRVLEVNKGYDRVGLVVSDEEGTGLILELMQYPYERQGSDEELIRKEQVFILKEPRFVAFAFPPWNKFGLRVDHMTDIVWLSPTDERVPKQWRAVPTGPWLIDIEALRRVKNAKKRKAWANVEQMCSDLLQAAKTSGFRHALYLKRAYANLRLGRAKSAFDDALLAEKIHGPSVKGLFLQFRAQVRRGFLQTGGSRTGREAINLALALIPKNSAVDRQLVWGMDRWFESQGSLNYDFPHMVQQAKRIPPSIDCATFSKLVEVRLSSPGHGNGLFLTEDVTDGAMVLCEKAFAFSWAMEDREKHDLRPAVTMDAKTRVALRGGQARLHTQIIQKLRHNPELVPEFEKLYADGHKPPYYSVDGQRVVDAHHVAKVIACSGMGAPYGHIKQTAFLDKIKGTAQTDHLSCGLWMLGSRINHSCMANCRRSFIGDMLIIRAIKELQKGSELVFNYRSTPRGLTASDQEALQRESPWAEPRRLIDKALHQKKVFAGQVKILLDSIRDRSDLQDLVESRLTMRNRNLPKSLDLAELYVKMGALYANAWQPKNAGEMCLISLELLGFAVATGHCRTEPTFKIVRWGVVTDAAVKAFSILQGSYPELRPVVKHYKQIVYSMVCGPPPPFFAGY
ncbi:hypothetical protein PG988_006664 [Apiospora saccharicola]